MKVLILMDFIRDEHMTVRDGKPVSNVFNTPNGKVLRQLLDKCAGLVIERGRKDYDIDYVYPRIPNPIRNDYGKIVKYQDVKQTEVSPFYEQNKQKIIDGGYDIVVPLGKLGTKMLLNNASIGKTRGVPAKVALKTENSSREVWVLPTYSIEYTNVNKNAERHVLTDLSTLGKFVKDGEDAFTPKEVKYELVTTIERVREIFSKEVKDDNKDGINVTAWDLETNSLHPDREGSKVLVLSMSWDNGQGVTIPIHKSDFQWENGEEDVKEILQLFSDWMGNKEDAKVAHGGKYDIKFLMTTHDIQTYESVYDTKVGWYLAVTQEQADSLRLSDLAYETTDIGGYDKPLEDFKVWFIKTLVPYLGKVLSDKVKLEVKGGNTDTDSITIGRESIDFNEELFSFEHYTSLSQEAKDYVIDTALYLINKFKKAKEVVNEVDGGDFDYDWIPLEMMHPYASGDTDCCRRVYTKVVEILKSQNRPKAFNLLQVDYPRLTRTLARIESNGMFCDAEYMSKNDEAYRSKMEELTDKMREHWAVKEFEQTQYDLYMLGVEEFSKPVKERDKEIAKYRDKFKGEKWRFNPTSSAHTGAVMYNILGIQLPEDRNYIKDTPFKSGKRGDDLTWEDFKTDKGAIEFILSTDIPDNVRDFIELLKFYGSLKTKRSSFTSKLPKMMNEKTKTLHGRFNETGTECVSGDTILVTDRGLVEIESLSTLREAKQFEDISMNIINKDKVIEKTDAFYYSGVGRAQKITLADGSVITTSYNHPLMKNLYYSEGKSVNKNKSFLKHLQERDWVEASDIKEGDYLQIMVGGKLYGDNIKLEVEGHKYNKTTNNIYYTLPETLTENLAELLGMYMADGSIHTSNGTKTIRVSNSSEQVLSRVVELFENIFSVKAVIVRPKERVPYVTVTSVGLVTWLEETFDIKKGAIGKNVPNLVMESTEEVQKAFIKGLTLDSSLKKKNYPSVYINTISEKMAFRVKAMLMNMGILCRLSTAKDSRGFSDCYSVQITYSNFYEFVHSIGFVQEDKNNYALTKIEEYKGKNGKNEGIIQGYGFVYAKVVSIEDVGDIPLFDLHVPETHSFIGNNIVSHNTGRLSSAQPNLQNIPKHTSNVRNFDYEHPIKRSFVSRFEGGVILQADYSALEMRVIALYTRDEAMIESFLNGDDIHKATAGIMNNKPADQVTAEERQNAKAVNQ